MRSIASRVLLSCLLLWQLGAGLFVHAHGLDSSATPVANSSIRPADAIGNEHCAEHETLLHSAALTETNAAVQEVDDHEQQAATDQVGGQAGCCESPLCNCPCAHAIALAALPAIPTLMPEFSVNAFAAPLLPPGVSGLFRPPI